MLLVLLLLLLLLLVSLVLVVVLLIAMGDDGVVMATLDLFMDDAVDIRIILLFLALPFAMVVTGWVLVVRALPIVVVVVAVGGSIGTGSSTVIERNGD